MKIGFFDSGLGGLAMLKAVAKELPQYDYYYYGDTAHVPYGDRSEAEIYELTMVAMRYLFEHECALVIVACNTASAETLRKLQTEFLPIEWPDRKILGVIIPTIEYLVDNQYMKALLLGTTRTVTSGKYELELDQRIPGVIDLQSVAAPSLVPLIEAAKFGEAAIEAMRLIDDSAREGDVVVLGCTHYAILKDRLRDYFGERRIILSQDEIIPGKLADYLDRHEEIRHQLTNTGKRDIYLTKLSPEYDYLAAQFLGGAYLPDE